MDCDDNDLNSQNFHLAGEGSAKFSPGLQPYALPKFDFDDNLQSHLRYDSLVETEVFLGIESNQDNNWIEDFSRGSSGIEFNPSPAEPCSISRRDNVWSEATSSESVEMLLKSVGQEEVIGVPTIIEESDACDELGCVTKQMDHSLEHEENILPGTEDVKVLENTIPSDEEVVKTSENSIPSDDDAKIIDNTLPSSQDVLTEENTLPPKEDVLTLETALTSHEDVKISENALPSDEVAAYSPDKGDVGEGQSGIKDTSQTQGVEVFVGGDSNLFDQSADGVKSALHLNEEVFANIGCGDEIERDIDDFPEKHVDVKSQGEPITPCLPSDILVVPIPDVATAVNEVANMDVQHQTSDSISEKPDDHVLREEAGMDDQNVDGNVVETSCVDEKLVHSASEEETMSKVSLEVSTCIVEELCSGSLKGQSDFCPVGDESLETMTIKDSKCEDVMMREGIPHDDDQLRADKPDVPICDAQFESSQIHTTLEPSVDYLDSSGKVDGLASGPQLDNKDWMQNAEVVVSSTEKLNTEIHVIVTNLAEPTLTPEKVGASADAERVSISEKQNARMLNACSNMDIDSPNKEAESSTGQDESRKELDTLILQHFTVVDSESAAAVTSSDLVSQATSDVVPVPSEDGVTIEVDQQSSQIPLPIVGSKELEEKEETFSITVVESAVSSDAVSSKVEAVPNSVSEAEKNIPCDTDRPSSSKVADESLPPTNIDGIETLTNASASTFVEASLECTTQVAEGDAAKTMVLSDTIPVAGNFVSKDAALDSEPNTGKETIFLLSESPLPSMQPRNEDKIILPTSVSPLPLVQPADSRLQDQEDNGGSSADQKTQVPDSSELSQIVSLDNGASSVVPNLPVSGSPMLSLSVEKSEKQDASASKVIGDKVKHKGSNSRAPKATVASKEEKTVSSLKLSKGAARRNLLPLPTDLTPRIAELSPSSSLPVEVELKIAQETLQANTQLSEVDISRGRPKSTSERKPRRSSVRATGKESAKKGSQPKETTPVGQPDNLNSVSVSPPALFHVMQSNEMQPYGHIDANNCKPYFVLATSTSSLPDLNSSASPSTVFQQPFTDFQQVQLRAQIFVYGALIQGTAPEEAYMMSAFGGLDGGRNLWYNTWQASIERLQRNKSTPVNPETPKNSRFSTSSVSRPVDQVSKQSASQNKGAATPVSRSTNKSSQSVVSPMIPLSSPLWNMPTPMTDSMQSGVLPRGSVMDYQQTLPHLHPLQTPPSRSLAGNNTSWMSQPSYRGPWQPSGLEASNLSAFPSTDTAQLTPVKETSVSQSSVKNVPSGPTVQTGAPTSVFTAASPLVDLIKGTPSLVQQSAEPKTKKRKKNSAPEEPSQTVLQSQPQFQPVTVPIVSSNLLTTAIKTPAPLVSQTTSEKLILPFPPPSLLDPLRKLECDVTQRAFLSVNSLVNIKEASKHAEDATTLASAAVGHSQEVWSQLEKQKKLGLVSDHEAKLACAAVAVAAAAAVARAAAAAANVASNAALQAKLMAEEIFGSNSAGKSDYATRILSSESGSALEKATHGSILRGDDIGSNSSSILTAAREAARRKVEAASAASMRAENMDAIVKAAELAAEAVSQAGKIVAMGDPFPLSELIEAGPEGYWRTPELVAKSTEMSRELFKAGGGGEGANTSTKHQKGGRSGKKGAQMTVSGQSSMDVTTWSESESVRRADDISGSVAVSTKERRGQKGLKVSDLTKNIVVVLESEPLSKSSLFNVDNEVEKAVQAPRGNSIKEGSKVEVFKDDDGFKAAWYTAVVLSMNEGKACVSYTEIEQEEGSTQLEEWVALAGEGDNSPRIRIARPVTALQYEGTRKRRRAAIGDYNWTVGDRVDAWMTNSWWEGVVTEKNKRDETSVTLHFPAQNETSTVKAWNLRPSLHWKDGEWVEWSNLQHDFSLQEGDIPLEKRPKLGGSPAVELKGKHKISSTSDDVNSANPEESRLLELSGIEKTFNVGKGLNRENKPDSTRMARTGLQKEGSRVVFGIPKPGKKRKFMEVSKHYVADKRNKNDEPSDSIKNLKYSVPQGSRALRNDSKEKRVAESKLKGFKPVKQQTAFGRTIPQKNFSSNSVSSSADSAGDAAKAKDYSGHNMSLRKQNTEEAGSFSNSEGASDGQFVFSTVASSDARPSRKIMPSIKLDRANKGKLAPAARKLGKIEVDKAKQDKTVTSTSEAVEPRRSNRRIQPTSRLLEGLQSSLIIPKFPSFSHDKGQRTQSKHTSRGNNHG